MTETSTSGQTMRIELPAQERETPRPRRPQTKGTRAHYVRSKLGPAEATLYNEFMQSIYDAVIVTDTDGHIVDGNIRAVEFLQYDIPELCQKFIFDIVNGFDQRTLSVIRENLDNNRFTLIASFCRCKDQSLFPTEIAPSRIHIGGETHYNFFVRDVTKRKEAEENLRKTQAQLDRAERLEMAGSIAGHIAHDFNNLLTPLMIYPGFIKEQLPEGSPAVKDLMVIEKTVKVIADINQQLLALSCRGYHEQTVLNINTIIQDTVDLLNRDIQAKGITFKLDLAKDLFNMKGSAQQLVRVIQNLCKNSIDAMEGQTEALTIRTENVRLDNPVKKYESVAVGDYVKVTVADTGHGIPADIQDRIFDPFFTTKPATRQRGSGLGLSVVHGIVKDHKGYLDVESTVGKGTVFSLYFPICRDEIKVLAEEKLCGGTETLLIMDDDSLQVEVISRMVAKLGYTVLSAQSGEEALAIIKSCQESNRPFPDMIILDMVMGPGMNGAQAFQRIKEINPQQKAIILSGYEESTKVVMAQSLGAGMYLRKPVGIEALAKAIRNELESSE